MAGKAGAMANGPLYAEVAVLAGQRAEGAFTYAVPAGMALRRGMTVAVPWRAKFAAGVVMRVSAESGIDSPREIIRALDPEPLIDGWRLETAEWIAHEYLAPLSDCAALFLPPGARRRAVADASALRAVMPIPPRAEAHLRLAERREAAGHGLDAWPKSKSSRPASLLSLLARGRWTAAAAKRIAGGPPALERWLDGTALIERRGDVVALAVPAAGALDAADALRRTAAERRQLALLRELSVRGPLPEADARGRSGATRKDVDLLERQDWIERVVAAAETSCADPVPPARLTPDQAAAAGEIRAALAEPARDRRAFLLHGVTGSGKTEVYLDAVAAALEAGGSAIVLVPEIALAPQTIRRVEARFPGQVAVQHSQLKPAEAREHWRRLAAGERRILVGARSALFAPLRGLALIVMDEAHEWTYKQSEQEPRYDAREAALAIARRSGAVVVFGTATPDVAMHARAGRDGIRLLPLPERVRPDAASPAGVAPADDPPIDVVDLRAELRAGNRSAISSALDGALRGALERGEQALLFLNRRGLGALLCRACGAAIECRRCSIAMTVHGRGAWLQCHGCGARERAPSACPACGDERVRPMRFGTEQLEAEVRDRFPGAGVSRWDRDTARGPGGHERILDEFAAGATRVLIGTQMIAKGLDLPQVTVAGVISADLGLHAPDYAAAERTFQLITQVAGRAGRGSRGGRVIVQTYAPDHYAVLHAAERDYEGFAAAELRRRAQLDYPPYGELALLRVAHRDAGNAEREASELASELRRERQFLANPPEVIGPAPARPERLRGSHRRQILLRGHDPARLLRGRILGRRWTVDVHPAGVS